MVFNWFRRQFSANEAQETSAPEPEVEQTDISQEAQPDTVSAPTSEVATDYLNWAKAAYKNIQERQAPPEEITEVDEESSEEQATSGQSEVPDEASEPAILAAETTQEEVLAPEIVSAPTVTIEPAIATEALEVVELPEADPVSEASQSPEAADSLQEVTATDNAIASEEVPESLPIWARDNRQERLERLKATAIEAPETAVQPAAETPTALPTDTESTPDLSFDEGFLWSAEVLAAQGRRPED